MTKPMGASEAGAAISRESMAHELDGGLASRAAIGLLVLATDQTIEREFNLVAGQLPGVAVYGARLINAAAINPQTLREMEALIAQTARLILPDLPLHVIGYGCTSASMVIGEEKVFARIREARPTIACTTPVTAAKAAFRALGMRRIALLTPYVESINRWMRDYFEAAGTAVPVMGSFSEEDDRRAARISPDSIRRAAGELLALGEVDGLFVACTSLRVVAACAALERQLGKPVTSSNHAMLWHCLRLAGIEDRLPQFGSLFTKELPSRELT